MICPKCKAEVPDQPGGLNSILEMLREAKINVEYMYAFVNQSGSHAIIIFRFDRTDQAIELLQQHGINMVPGDTLYKM